MTMELLAAAMVGYALGVWWTLECCAQRSRKRKRERTP